MKNKMTRYDVVVVGAGASGMMAAITAAKQGASVLLLEHMECAGKKILSTGNGKCNYTNEKQGLSYYRGENPAFVLPVFSQFGVKETLAFFEKLGVYPKEKNGYYYPASEQASSVLKVLLMELRRLSVEIRYEIGIRSIQKEKSGFCFETKSGFFYGTSCILATGGFAAKKTGSDGSGFLYAKKLGHHLSNPVPALVQLVARDFNCKDWAGIRIEANLKLYVEDRILCEDTGEIQLTDYGISGIPTFQVSRFAAKALQKGEKVKAMIDFLPKKTEKEVFLLLKQRFYDYGSGKNINEALIGLFPEKLITVFCKKCNASWLTEKFPAKRITEKELHFLCKQIKQFTLWIEKTKPFDMAQVTAGGILTEELKNDTLESKFIPGLYFAGEIIDIDGMCGGYNLQWAWSSGYVAGYAAASRIRQDKK